MPEDLTFCPFCNHANEAGGDNNCTCEDDETRSDGERDNDR